MHFDALLQRLVHTHHVVTVHCVAILVAI